MRHATRAARMLSLHLVLLLGLLSRPVAAETEEEKQARIAAETEKEKQARMAAAAAAAADGSKLLANKEFKRALEKFNQARSMLRDKPSPILLRDIGLAHEGLSDLLSAKVEYENAMQLVLAPTASQDRRKAQEDAGTRLKSLETRIPTLYIDTSAAPKETTIAIDSREVPLNQLNKPLPKNPGPYWIDATYAGRWTRMSPVVLVEGQHERLIVSIGDKGVRIRDSKGRESIPARPLEDKGDSPANGGASSTTLTPNTAESSASSVPAIVAFSLGGAGLLTGIITAIASFRQSAGSNKTIPLSIVSGVSLGVGGAVIIAGVHLMPTAPKPVSAGNVTFLVGPGSLAVKGTF